MMKRRFARGVVALCLLGTATPAFAGAWTQEPGATYVKIWDRGLFGRDAFASDGTGRLVGLDEAYVDQQLQAYAEVGLADGVTLVSYAAPFGMTQSGSNVRPYMGALWSGLRARLVQVGAAVLSVQATTGGRPPVGNRPILDRVLSGERVVLRSTLGTAQADGELQLGLGLGRWWVAANAGARGFTNGAFNPAATAYIQLGWTIGSRVTLDVHAPVHWSLGELTELDVLGIANSRYVGIGSAISVRVSQRVAVTAGGDGAMFAASNAAAPALIVGVELW